MQAKLKRTRRGVRKGGRAFLATAATLALSAALVGCASSASTATTSEEHKEATSDASTEKAENTSYPVTYTLYDGDGASYEQTFERAPERVVTLTDSAAEIMCRLGLADKVVGTVTSEAPMPDDIAAAYASIPQLGDKKTLSREAIVGSGPDLVIGRAQTSTAANQTNAESYNALGIGLYTQVASSQQGDPTLAGIIVDVKNIATIFDVQEEAVPLVADLEARLARMEERVAATASGEPQRVLIMTNFKDGTFGLFGGATGASLQFNLIDSFKATMASTQSASGLTYENLIEFDPDVILYITAERNKATDGAVLDTLYGESSIQSVPAIAEKRVVEIPYAEFMDYSPRVFDSAEKILDALYPTA